MTNQKQSDAPAAHPTRPSTYEGAHAVDQTTQKDAQQIRDEMEQGDDQLPELIRKQAEGGVAERDDEPSAL